MMNTMNNQTVQTASGDSIIARNKVLRQTYILLGANVLFSAVCAFVGMQMGIGQIPWFVAMIALIGLSMGISANRNSGLGIVLLFALTGFLGVYTSNILSMFFSMGAGSVVVKALVGTGIIFFGLSAYVLTTGKNFTFLGGFLFVGVMVALLAGIGAMVFGMTALSLVVSGAFLLIFSGYVLYDTSNIVHGHETNYIVATLNLFMNIFNIFLSLLNLIGAFSGD
ncbi:Bax inhibitor-1/YccA family protein [Suttonella sp. R2A3]|uniref:Bax inhibitor-1/YccA family protein n=1 Tax=Suttonella sp. R2A3 TaxID=2908648 RepID=UPI001F167BB3|nr:Bax inhibitor-1/YccA family protein [Suttonella sp. R2A3]UJF25368.1 Bax inhibitor-1/YccA family protein [Suttonella sp. R2A3]